MTILRLCLQATAILQQRSQWAVDEILYMNIERVFMSLRKVLPTDSGLEERWYLLRIYIPLNRVRTYPNKFGYNKWDVACGTHIFLLPGINSFPVSKAQTNASSFFSMAFSPPLLDTFLAQMLPNSGATACAPTKPGSAIHSQQTH